MTAYGSVGKSPLGVRRDVKITVKTADVTKVVTPWFMATRRLATGKAGFKTTVNRHERPPRPVGRGRIPRQGRRRSPGSNLLVTWRWTFADGSVQRTTGYHERRWTGVLQPCRDRGHTPRERSRSGRGPRPAACTGSRRRRSASTEPSPARSGGVGRRCRSRQPDSAEGSPRVSFPSMPSMIRSI